MSCDRANAAQYRDRLFRHAYRKVKRPDVAEDVVQEALARWYQSDRRDVSSPYAWLVTVVNNLCVEHWRRGSREISVDSLLFAQDDAAPGNALEQWCDVVEAISLAMHSLNTEQRAALILRDMFDWPYDDVALTLKKSNAACRQLVHRARLVLGRTNAQRVRTAQKAVVMRFLQALRAEDPMAAIQAISRTASAA